MDLAAEILMLGQRARKAARALARLDTNQKNAGLHAMADALVRHRDAILAANSLDVEAAAANGLSERDDRPVAD